jgi:hypothetical protein
MIIKQNWTYDEECFTNLFTITFKCYETKEITKFIVWYDPEGIRPDINQLFELVKFVFTRVHRLIGYNNREYDNPLLNAILLQRELFCKSTSRRVMEELKTLSNLLIEAQHAKDENGKRITIQEVVSLKRFNFFESVDVLNMFNTVDRVGLKQVAINLRWPNILDLPFHHTALIPFDQIEFVLFYNLNDVNITEYILVEKLSEQFTLRKNIVKRFGVDVLDSNDTDIAKKLISKYYIEATGITQGQLNKLRTFYTHIHLKDCISPRINLHSRQGKHLLETIRKTTIDPNKKESSGKKKKQFEYIYKSKYVTHTIGLGGIHSNNPPEIIEESDDFWLLDIDAISFYPYIIVNDNLYPAHLGPKFITIYRDKILIPRVEAKLRGDKVGAGSLKITANGTYGLTKSKHSFMCDAKVTTFTCISGQLYLIMLMEAIESNTSGIIVYSNTDGLTVKLKKSEYLAVKRICDLWCAQTGFELEYTRFRKMVIHNINNFLIFTHDDKNPIKAKGEFLVEKPMQKGYEYPIIAKALVDFYDKGIPVEDTISFNQDIFMYMKAERMDESKFKAVIDRRDVPTETLQKSNRWVVTDGYKNEGKLYKQDKVTNAREELQKGYIVTILNELPEDKDLVPTPNEVKINYSFYLTKVLEIKNLITPNTKATHIETLKQAVLF